MPIIRFVYKNPKRGLYWDGLSERELDAALGEIGLEIDPNQPWDVLDWANRLFQQSEAINPLRSENTAVLQVTQEDWASATFSGEPPVFLLYRGEFRRLVPARWTKTSPSGESIWMHFPQAAPEATESAAERKLLANAILQLANTILGKDPNQAISPDLAQALDAIKPIAGENE